MRAPGAKTFLQVIKARFGKKTHITYCLYAGFTNLVVTASLIIAGCAVLSGTIRGLNPELAIILVAAVIGGYTMIGGLGATFYVSYFNTTIIFIGLLLLVTEVFYNPSEDKTNIFGSSDKVYNYLICWEGPEGNKAGSYLTFLSEGGILFGVINIIGNFGTVFCDQSYWQSSVAAKPTEGVWGFILGGLTWFAIPFAFATTMGLAYLGLSSAQGTELLTPLEVDKGLVAPMVAQTILGEAGEYVMVVLILMAVMSTGSAEIIAVSSVIIYDIIQTYIFPFRKNLKDGECILCLKPYSKGSEESSSVCSCSPVSSCAPCLNDVCRKGHKMMNPTYTCDIHGEYKTYLDYFLHLKNWSIVWITLALIPLYLICYNASLNLSWIYLFTGIVISSATFPIAMSVMWARVNATAMMVSPIGGSICAVISWLSTASTFPGGLHSFLENTGRELPMLVGNVVSILSGAILCILITLCTTGSYSDEKAEREWEKTRNIDNPLNPWIEIYKQELQLESVKWSFLTKIPYERAFLKAKFIAFGVGIALTILLLIIWPVAVTSVQILDSNGFYVWTFICRGWAFCAATFIIIVPLVQEVQEICKKIKENKKILPPRFKISAC